MVANRTRAALAVAAGLGVLILLALTVGFAPLTEVLARASPLHLFLALATYALFFVARGIRWRLLLLHEAPRLSVATTTNLTAVGWLANSFLPLKGGDVLRIAWLSKRARVPIASSATSVALERLLDMLGLALLATLALWLVPRATDLPTWLRPAIEIVAFAPLFALIALIVLVGARERALSVLARVLVGRWGRKLHAFFGSTLEGIATLRCRPALLVALIPATLTVSGLQALIFTFLAMAFFGNVGLVLAFAGSSLFLLSFVVSITPGNLGTYEAGFVAVFVALGVPVDLAIPTAILTHVTTTLMVGLLGGAALVILGARPASLLQPAPAPDGGSP